MTFLVGSALGDFCQQVATQYNAQRPKLAGGKEFHLACVTKGRGAVVSDMFKRAQQLKNGILKADTADWSTLL